MGEQLAKRLDQRRRIPIADSIAPFLLALTLVLDHFQHGPARFFPHYDSFIVFGICAGGCWGVLEICCGHVRLGMALRQFVRALAQGPGLLRIWRREPDQPASWPESIKLVREQIEEILEITGSTVSPDLVELYEDCAHRRSDTPAASVVAVRRLVRHTTRNTLTLQVSRCDLPGGARLLIVGGIGSSAGLIVSVLRMLQSGIPPHLLILGLVLGAALEWRSRRHARRVPDSQR